MTSPRRSFFFLMLPPPPRSTLFPYTTLFRSDLDRQLDRLRARIVEEHGIGKAVGDERSEEHTSELQSRVDLVCRLLLEKKKPAKEVIEGSKPQPAGPKDEVKGKVETLPGPFK